MKKYSTILFDLDGTIIDPIVGIVNSVKFALDTMKIEYDPSESFKKFIGPPLDESFRNFYSLSDSQAKNAVDHYRINYKKQGMGQNHLYPGIAALIKDLYSRNILLFLATSKPTPFAIEILQHYKLNHYFQEIIGSNLDLTRTAKNEIIGYILQKFPDIDPRRCVMIGDRNYDIVGAQQNHIDSIGVNYGYGSFTELQDANSTYIADSVEALRKILL
jgi:phosphoglycolate phosphatase